MLIDFHAPYPRNPKDYDGAETNEETEAIYERIRAEEVLVSKEVEKRRGWRGPEVQKEGAGSDIDDKWYYFMNWACAGESLYHQLLDELLSLRELQGADDLGVHIIASAKGFMVSLLNGRGDDDRELETDYYPTMERAVCAAWCAAYDAGWFEQFEEWVRTTAGGGN